MELIPRAYQLAIYNSCIEKGNTLVVLPTGLGKTLIALMLMREKSTHGKCLFLTPTKPLAKQHVKSIEGILGTKAVLVTGEKKAEERKAEYAANLLIATPQTINNDLQSGILQPDFSLVIVDEAHRAVGDYAYVKIVQAMPETALIVGLTASPGGKKDRVEEVLLHLRTKNIEIRTSFDEDVQQYVQQSTIKWLPVKLSPMLFEIQQILQKLISRFARALSALGYVPPLKHKGLFVQLRHRILENPNKTKYTAMMFYSALWHVLHMQELIETQGVYALRRYLEKLGEKESKSAAMLLKDDGIGQLLVLTKSDEEHPKLKVLMGVLEKLKGKKAIVFAQYRDQIALLERKLQEAGYRAKQFVGKKQGYTRKMQEETMQEFRDGKFDIMVSSSIGEEGLDVPSVDAVIFYEPIPSEIRSIQRRGRAARLKEGEIFILMTKGNRDEHYYW